MRTEKPLTSISLCQPLKRVRYVPASTWKPSSANRSPSHRNATVRPYQVSWLIDAPVGMSLWSTTANPRQPKRLLPNKSKFTSVSSADATLPESPTSFFGDSPSAPFDLSRHLIVRKEYLSKPTSNVSRSALNSQDAALTPVRFRDTLAANESSFGLGPISGHHLSFPCNVFLRIQVSDRGRPGGFRNPMLRTSRFARSRRELVGATSWRLSSDPR